jgi:hypothetical protein
MVAWEFVLVPFLNAGVYPSVSNSDAEPLSEAAPCWYWAKAQLSSVGAAYSPSHRWIQANGQISSNCRDQFCDQLQTISFPTWWVRTVGRRSDGTVTQSHDLRSRRSGGGTSSIQAATLLDHAVTLWTQHRTNSLFAWTFSRLFLASQQCFSLTTNQPIVLSAAYFQPSEQALRLCTLGLVNWYWSCTCRKKKLQRSPVSHTAKPPVR